MDFVERNSFHWEDIHGAVKIKLNLSKHRSKMEFLMLKFALKNVYRLTLIKSSNVVAVRSAKALVV